NESTHLGGTRSAERGVRSDGTGLHPAVLSLIEWRGRNAGRHVVPERERSKRRLSLNRGEAAGGDSNGGKGRGEGRNPVRVVDTFASIARVGPSSQPWALGRNPFGIGEGNELGQRRHRDEVGRKNGARGATRPT